MTENKQVFTYNEEIASKLKSKEGIFEDERPVYSETSSLELNNINTRDNQITAAKINYKILNNAACKYYDKIDEDESKAEDENNLIIVEKCLKAAYEVININNIKDEDYPILYNIAYFCIKNPEKDFLRENRDNFIKKTKEILEKNEKYTLSATISFYEREKLIEKICKENSIEQKGISLEELKIKINNDNKNKTKLDKLSELDQNIFNNYNKYYKGNLNNIPDNVIYNMAYCYEFGIGHKKDETTAFNTYLNKEVRYTSNSDVENKIGVLFYNEKEGDDIGQAIEHFKQAAAQGNKNAIENLRLIGVKEEVLNYSELFEESEEIEQKKDKSEQKKILQNMISTVDFPIKDKVKDEKKYDNIIYDNLEISTEDIGEDINKIIKLKNKINGNEEIQKIEKLSDIVGREDLFNKLFNGIDLDDESFAFAKRLKDNFVKLQDYTGKLKNNENNVDLLNDFKDLTYFNINHKEKNNKEINNFYRDYEEIIEFLKKQLKEKEKEEKINKELEAEENEKINCFLEEEKEAERKRKEEEEAERKRQEEEAERKRQEEEEAERKRQEEEAERKRQEEEAERKRREEEAERKRREEEEEERKKKEEEEKNQQEQPTKLESINILSKRPKPKGRLGSLQNNNIETKRPTIESPIVKDSLSHQINNNKVELQKQLSIFKNENNETEEITVNNITINPNKIFEEINKHLINNKKQNYYDDDEEEEEEEKINNKINQDKSINNLYDFIKNNEVVGTFLNNIDDESKETIRKNLIRLSSYINKLDDVISSDNQISENAKKNLDEQFKELGYFNERFFNDLSLENRGIESNEIKFNDQNANEQNAENTEENDSNDQNQNSKSSNSSPTDDNSTENNSQNIEQNIEGAKENNNKQDQDSETLLNNSSKKGQSVIMGTAEKSSTNNNENNPELQSRGLQEGTSTDRNLSNLGVQQNTEENIKHSKQEMVNHLSNLYYLIGTSNEYNNDKTKVGVAVAHMLNARGSRNGGADGVVATLKALVNDVIDNDIGNKTGVVAENITEKIFNSLNEPKDGYAEYCNKLTLSIDKYVKNRGSENEKYFRQQLENDIYGVADKVLIDKAKRVYNKKNGKNDDDLTFLNNFYNNFDDGRKYIQQTTIKAKEYGIELKDFYDDENSIFIENDDKSINVDDNKLKEVHETLNIVHNCLSEDGNKTVKVDSTIKKENINFTKEQIKEIQEAIDHAERVKNQFELNDKEKTKDEKKIKDEKK